MDAVDAVYDRVVQGGVVPGCPPENQPWGGRTFWLRDLNRFVLSFSQLVEEVTLEEIRRRYEEAGKGEEVTLEEIRHRYEEAGKGEQVVE